VVNNKGHTFSPTSAGGRLARLRNAVDVDAPASRLTSRASAAS
jgi:hypothetical protein